MKITATEKTGLKRTYDIIVPANEVDGQLQTQLKSIGQKAKIPGFRPGKIPMSVLKARYGKEVMDEVLWNCVNSAARKLTEDEHLRPAMQPDVNITTYKEDGDLHFTLSLEVMPEVPELDYDAIEVADYEFEVPQDEIEQGLDRLAKSRKHYHAADAKAKASLGDAVKIDFLGKLDGVPFEGGKGEGFQLELGSGQFIPGFEEQLVGAKAGDAKTLRVTFPAHYHSDALAGKEAEFDVTVHEVLTPHVPDINDALAEKIGFDDLNALKEAIRQQIEVDYKEMARNKAKKALFDWLDTHVRFDTPQKMREMEFNSVWEQLQRAKAQGDTSLDKPEEELRSEYQAIAERRVRLGILLSEIGRKHNLQISKDELTRAVMAQAQMFPGQEQKVFEFYQKNPQHVDELRGPIIEDKAVDFILGKVKRPKKKVTLDALIQDEEESDDAGANAKSQKKSDSKKRPSSKSEEAAPKSSDSSAGSKKRATSKK